MRTPDIQTYNLPLPLQPGFTEQDSIDTAQGIADRFKPIPESPGPFPTEGSISFTGDFQLIDNLRLKLGINRDQRVSHDPALERARYERVKTKEDRQSVRRGVIIDMETTLMERARSTHNTVLFFFNEQGMVYHPDFPGEPFDVVLQRGIENSRRNGFVDYEREVAEFKGCQEVMQVLFNKETPLESKEIVISGPSAKKGTSFTDNFVDVFTKTIDPLTGKVIVVMSRFASGADYGEYKKIALRLDSNYFNSRKGEPEDEFYKAHPIFIDGKLDARRDLKLFEEEFVKQKGAMGRGQTRSYLDECRTFILHYADQICADFFDPKQIKLAFNAVLNRFDEARKGVIRKSNNNVAIQIIHYGMMKVQEIMVGCGLSAGFSLGGGLKSIAESILKTAGGIIGKFTGSYEKNKWDYHKGNCVVCKNSNLEVGPCEICKACEKTFD